MKIFERAPLTTLEELLQGSDTKKDIVCKADSYDSPVRGRLSVTESYWRRIRSTDEL